MSLSDYEELDFDDPRFLELAATAAPPAELSYAQRRKRALIRAEDKGRSKSRKQEEEERRAEGLGTNLIQRAEEDGADSKALQMMKSMGYTPGEAVGRVHAAPSFAASTSATTEPGGSEGTPAASGSTPKATSSRGGLGFARASFAPVGGENTDDGASNTLTSGPAPQAAARTEPIRFEMRAGRSGLGVPQASRLKPYLSAPTSSSRAGAASALGANSDPSTLPDLAGYLSHLKSTVDARRAHGLLRALRRTCEELDRRAGETESFMWRDPDEELRDAETQRRRKVFDRIENEVDDSDGEVEPSFGGGVGGSAARGDLAYERGESRTVVEIEPDSEDDQDQEKAGGLGDSEGEEFASADRRRPAQVEQAEADEEEEWFAMDVQSRLALMLTYLRNKYHYCFWCGCQYNDAKDLDDNCPGPDEDDH